MPLFELTMKRSAPAAAMPGKFMRGGYHQRILAATALANNGLEAASSGANQSAQPTRHSYLAKELMRDCLWGDLPCAKARKYAEAAVKDGLACSDLRVLSRLGSMGRHTGHCWRDLKMKCRRPKIRCHVVPVKLKSKQTQEEKSFDGSLGIIYPHELFATLHADYNKEFCRAMLGGSPDTVHRFWDKMDKHPSYASHPMHRHALSSFKTHGIPLRIHGDETPVTGVGKTWSKLVDATSWSSCLVNQGQARRNNFLMGYVFSDLLFEEGCKQIRRDNVETFDLVILLVVSGCVAK